MDKLTTSDLVDMVVRDAVEQLLKYFNEVMFQDYGGVYLYTSKDVFDEKILNARDEPPAQRVVQSTISSESIPGKFQPHVEVTESASKIVFQAQVEKEKLHRNQMGFNTVIKNPPIPTRLLDINFDLLSNIRGV